MIPDGRSLGRWLQNARVAKRITLLEIASQLKIDPCGLNEIENGRRCPSESLVRDFTKVLGLDFERAMAHAGRLFDTYRSYSRYQPGTVVLANSRSGGESERRSGRP